jgi:hypothetical protein
MAKQRPSLSSVAGSVAGAVAPKPPESIAVVKPIRPKPKPAGRAHTSIYIDRKVSRVLRRIAIETGRDRAHDVMLEAIDDVLRKYGLPSIDEIEQMRDVREIASVRNVINVNNVID